MNLKNPKILTFLTFVVFVVGISFLSSEAFKQYQSIETNKDVPSKIVNQPQEAGQSGVVQGIQGDQAYVTDVIDGDTIKVIINTKEYTVRFVGIDTPETRDPRRPVGCFGKEASNKTKELLKEKTVILQKDITDTDKYDRLLRYVYLPLEDGRVLFVNDYLVREGFAKVYTYPPDIKFNEQFLEAQRQAQAESKGLWGKCD